MAERRFHDLIIDEEYFASFEDGIGKVEAELFPYYRRVIEKRKLDRSPELISALAIFTAFQMIRTRWQRDQFARVEQKLADKLEKMGSRIFDIEGYVPLTDETLKIQHIKFMRSSLHSFSEAIAEKVLFLLQAPSGRSFYLSDNPVCMHNDGPDHPIFGNVG